MLRSRTVVRTGLLRGRDAPDITLELMNESTKTPEMREPGATEVMFRDAERHLDESLEQALPALRGAGLLWVDQSYRIPGWGSARGKLAWRFLFTRAWQDEHGSACVLLEVSAFEPYDVEWGVPVHWTHTAFSEPRLLSDALAHGKGNMKLPDAISEGLETFILRHIRREAKRVGREL
jgi:hypothetical protein